MITLRHSKPHTASLQHLENDLPTLTDSEQTSSLHGKSFTWQVLSTGLHIAFASICFANDDVLYTVLAETYICFGDDT